MIDLVKIKTNQLNVVKRLSEYNNIISFVKKQFIRFMENA